MTDDAVIACILLTERQCVFCVNGNERPLQSACGHCKGTGKALHKCSPFTI